MKKTLFFLGLFSITFLSGCASWNAPGHKGPVSDHFDGKIFKNLDPNYRKKGFGEYFKWQRNRDHIKWPKFVSLEKTDIPPKSYDDGNSVRLSFVGHSTVLIQWQGKNILIDPVWSKNVGPYSWVGPKRRHPPGIKFDDLPKIDAILISHNHYDHLDLPTLKKIVDRDATPIMAGLGTKAFLKQNDIPIGVDLDWWQSNSQLGDLILHFVPVNHWSIRGPSDKFNTLWGGFVIENKSGKRLFYAGDTGFGLPFELIQKRFKKLHVSILPIGAYLPRWFMKENHINPSEAVKIHRMLNSDFSLGVHFGTFKQSDERFDQPPNDLKSAIKNANYNNPNNLIKPTEFIAIQPGTHVTHYFKAPTNAKKEFSPWDLLRVHENSKRKTEMK